MYTMVPPVSPPSMLPPAPPCGAGGGVVYMGCSTPLVPLLCSGLWVSSLVFLLLPPCGVVVGGGCWV